MAGVDLAGLAGPDQAGAVFRLATPERRRTGESWFVHEAPGYRAVLVPGRGIATVVVNGLPVPADILDECLGAAQQACDLACISGKGALALSAAEDENLIWTRDAGILLARWTSPCPFRMSMTVTATVLRDGVPVPQPSRPLPAWDSSLRFFRLSQLAEDAFDSYRNLFLALEAVLSHTGSAETGDGKWLRDALRQTCTAHKIDIAHYVVAPTAGDPLDKFMDEQYKALRCATFHAKSHRPTLLPRSARDRQQVLRAIEPMARLVIDLLRCVVGVTFPSGGLTYAGFEAATANLRADGWTADLMRDDSPVRGEQTEHDLPDGIRVHLHRVDVIESPGTCAVTYAADRSHDWPDQPMNSIVAFRDGSLMTRDEFPPLELGCVARFEARSVWILENPQQPRVRFRH